MLRDNFHVMLSVLQIGSSWVRYLMSEALWSHGTWYLVDCLNAESCKECCGGSTDSRENSGGDTGMVGSLAYVDLGEERREGE